MAARVVDGLFVGDALSSMDVNFLVANKIARVVNCAALELENRWEALGIEYMNFPWIASDCFDMLNSDGSSKVWESEAEAKAYEVEGCPCVWLGKICVFIEEALQEGLGVLVHSQDGTNRACSCVLAYMMNVYGWNLHKSASFMQSKRPDLVPSPSYNEQLQRVSDWLEVTYREAVPHSEEWVTRKFRSWDIANIDLFAISTRAEEELLLHNTYLNSSVREDDTPRNLQGASTPNRQTSHAWHTSQSPYFPHEQYDGNNHAQGASHTSTPRNNRTKNTKNVTWIDSEEIIKRGLPVMRSPFSKRAVPERPPGPSYQALVVTGQWLETDPEHPEEDRASPVRSSARRSLEEDINALGSPPILHSDLRRQDSSLLMPTATAPNAVLVPTQTHEPEAKPIPAPQLESRTAHVITAADLHLNLGNVDLGRVRSALLAKGVAENASPHALRPPSPPRNPSPLRRRARRSIAKAAGASPKKTLPKHRKPLRSTPQSHGISSRVHSGTDRPASGKSGRKQASMATAPLQSSKDSSGQKIVRKRITTTGANPSRTKTTMPRNGGSYSSSNTVRNKVPSSPSSIRRAQAAENIPGRSQAKPLVKQSSSVISSKPAASSECGSAASKSRNVSKRRTKVQQQKVSQENALLQKL